MERENVVWASRVKSFLLSVGLQLSMGDTGRDTVDRKQTGGTLRVGTEVAGAGSGQRESLAALPNPRVPLRMEQRAHCQGAGGQADGTSDSLP